MPRGLVALLLTGGLSFTSATPLRAANAVVGSGTAASCTEAALNAAVATVLPAGGTISFNCGGPATINITSEKLFFYAPDPYLTYTIDGGGIVTLNGNGATRHIFHMSGILNVRNITLTGGRAIGAADAASGGSIRSDRSTVLVPSPVMALNLTNVTFTNNATALTTTPSPPYNPFDYGGGAVFSRLAYLTVSGCTFANNAANNSAGGAIHGRSSAISITGSRFASNMSNGGGYGGAMHVDGVSPTGSNGSLQIASSSFTGNTTYNQAGAIYFYLHPEKLESVLLDAVNVVGNSIVDSGLDVWVGNRGIGGGLAGDHGDVTIRNSTFANNTSRGEIATGGGGAGGGLSLGSNRRVVITNTTVSGNRALGSNGDASGGGLLIFNNVEPFQIVHSTIAFNQAGWTGGGILSSTNGTLTNTIVSNNTAGNPGFGTTIQQQCSSQLTNGGGVLHFPDIVGAATAGNPRCAAGAIVANPQLEALAGTGGFTQTHTPQGASVINAVPCAISTDQRGVPRPQAGLCDIGAVEVLPSGPLTHDLTTSFGPAYGLWTFSLPASWQALSGLGAEAMVTADLDGNGRDDLVVDFGAAHPYQPVWIWLNHTSWIPLRFPLNPNRLAAGDLDGDGRDELILIFSSGVVVCPADGALTSYVMSPTREVVANLDGGSSEELVVSDANGGVLVLHEGTSWTSLHPQNVSRLAAGDIDGNGRDDLVLDFPGGGLWVFRNNQTWTPLHSFPAAHLSGGDLDGNGQSELIVDFGPSYGVWIYSNDATWSQLHDRSADSLTTTDLDVSGQADVVIDFGPLGLWLFGNNASWQMLHGFDVSSVSAWRLQH